MATTGTTLSCKLCSKAFTDPRLLPCLHIFCKSCLESLQSQNEGSLTCPTCYKTSPLPPADLPRHLRIEREVAMSRIQEGGEAMCGICNENNGASAYCEECASNLCSDCVRIHARFRTMRSHTIVPLTSASVMSVPSFLCSVHSNEVIKYYCLSCGSLVCSDCLIFHKKHDWRPLDEAKDIERGELQAILQEVDKAIPPIATAVKLINNVCKFVSSNKDRVEEQIDEACRKIIAAVDKRRAELLQEVRDSAVSKTTQLEIQKESLEKILGSLQLALQSGSAVCDEYTTTELLVVKPSLHQTSSNLLEELHSTELTPVCSSSLTLVADDTSKVTEMISIAGKILACNSFPPLCTLDGIDPKLSIGVAKGCESVVTLQTRDSRGEDVMEGGADVRGTLTSGSEVSECRVRDLRNGKYEISFDNPAEDQYQLDISIDDISIGNCPFNVNVRDFTAIQNSSLCTTTQPNPVYIDIGSDGMLYVGVDEGSIEVFSGEEKVKELPQSKLGVNKFRGIAVDDQNGVLFVASAGTNQIIKATLDGEVIASVGELGTGELEFKFPFGLYLTKENTLLVADKNNRRVQVLGSDLSFIRSISCHSNVYGVSVDNTGNIHAVTKDRVEVFSKDGEKITEYGEGVLEDARDVAFLRTHSSSQSFYSFVTDFTSDEDDNLFIFDCSNGNLVHSLRAGCHPVGIRIDQEGQIFLSSWNHNKVLIF